MLGGIEKTAAGLRIGENLRWKGLFVDAERDTPTGSDHIFWCLKTQIVLGPDGQLVDKYECNPGRSCYRAL